MRTVIALSLSALLLVGCPDDGTGGGGGDGTGASGGDGTGGSLGDACGAGTACDSDDGDSGEWCVDNVCGTQENLIFAFCNDNPENPNADGEFGCGCVADACSRTEENNCFAPTDCTLGPDGDSLCESVCDSECGGPDEWRDGFCAGSGPDTAFCECFCADGTGTCFE